MGAALAGLLADEQPTVVFAPQSSGALKTLVERSGARYLGAAVVVDALTDHQVRRDLNLASLLNVRDLR